MASSVKSRAHPRSRGENEKDPYSDETLSGSSPLTRGKPCRRHAARDANGLIPAHAGKTRTALTQLDCAGAHPRSRGENFPDDCVHVGITGSSPLTRGKRQCWRGHGDGGWLIPAHAGKTPLRAPTCGNREAHPRSRGENANCLAFLCVSAGSSPLTRGKLRSMGD